MKLAKTVFAGIAISVLGVLSVGVGAAITASEYKKLEPILENAKEGTYDLGDDEGAITLQFVFDACDVNIHTTDKEESYIAYSINGVSNVHVGDNLFEVTQESGLSIFYWLKLVGTNEVDLFLSKSCMASDSLNIIINAGDVSVDKDIVLKSFSIEMNAGNMEIEGIQAENFNVEINAGNMEIYNADITKVDFTVNAGNLDVEMKNPQSWYDIEVSKKLGDFQMSPEEFETGKNHQSGDKAGYSINGTINMGSVEIAFAK